MIYVNNKHRIQPALWQVNTSFDKSKIHEVISIYHWFMAIEILVRYLMSSKRFLISAKSVSNCSKAAKSGLHIILMFDT
jgi:hypothetical protein